MAPRRHGPEVRESDAVTRSIEVAEGDGLTLLISAADGVRTFRVPPTPELVIGRTEDADVVVADPSVSRRHAVLRLAGSMTVEDLASSNGTRVNGARVTAGERAPVTVGTLIEVGNATMVVQRSSAVADAKLGRRADDAAPSTASEAASAVVRDASMKRIYALLDVIGPSPLHVLLLGETGVGKEVFAAALHASSRRSAAPLLRLNCAALPDSVLEGELFGYERGAFTGATQARPGLFESADGGTVFLDEVGELPMTTQAKLLRVLESGEVLRLGARRTTRVDVRFLSATNRDLRYLVASGAFRADLFFRLNGVSITIPPLRERTSDIAPLAALFLSRIAERSGGRALRVAPEVALALERYAWPGNVRELRNVIERGAVFCAGAELRLDDLSRAAPEVLGGPDGSIALPQGEDPGAPAPPAPGAASAIAETAIAPAPSAAPAPPDAPLRGRLRDRVSTVEREQIESALSAAHGNQKRAAEILGVSRRTLINKIEAHGIGRPRKRSEGG